ncbi:GNAT family N-acetyltransferase [Microlunatus flavus]|uniref:Protein N-acetyltransferase, RimJ/RimL family n=1 Tax=Microlunatus flavus TaxID=1036181 RepID=A0A1H9G6D1_9ACTN|nr:GNAT family N-acetyltransferase [Microlunatus flavus]SEQ45705.1 Protein N-acetyltransferase, RimJ/RimL family [Microlunatus flavus]
MLTLPHPLVTERLVLRPIDATADVDAIHAYASREDVCRYIPWTPKTREDVVAWLPRRTATTIRQEGAGASLAVTLRTSGELVGDVILIWRSAAHRTAEIGYVIHPDHAGHGYASEAARALLGVAFDDLGMHRVVARIDERNPASAAVLRRIGMRQEAVLVENEWFKGAWTTEVDFALLESEWRAR